MLTVCYDLAKCPPTFDAVTAALRFEEERIRRGADALAIEVLPGPEEGFRRDRAWPHGGAARRRMLEDVALPIFGLLPHLKSIVTRSDRAIPADTFGFNDYCMGFGHFLRLIGRYRPLRPRLPVERRSRLITMTLRESEHHPRRNSHVAEWERAGIVLKDMGFKIVAVRDTLKASEQFGAIATAPYASRNIEARAALYRSAACNLFVNNGPAWLCMALDAPMLMLRPATEGAGMLYNAKGLERLGLPPGTQIAGAPPYQRLVWKDDTMDNIVAACCGFMAEMQVAA